MSDNTKTSRHASGVLPARQFFSPRKPIRPIRQSTGGPKKRHTNNLTFNTPSTSESKQHSSSIPQRLPVTSVVGSTLSALSSEEEETSVTRESSLGLTTTPISLDQSVDSIFALEIEGEPKRLPERPPNALLMHRQKTYYNENDISQTVIDSVLEPSSTINNSRNQLNYNKYSRDLGNVSRHSLNNTFKPILNKKSSGIETQNSFLAIPYSSIMRPPSHLLHPTPSITATDKKNRKRVYQLWPGRNRFFLGGRIITSRDFPAFVVAFSMLITSWTDPGIIPRKLDPSPTIGEYEEGENVLNNSQYPYYPSRNSTLPKDIRINGQRITLKYCETCKIYRPPRCSHCRQCDNCVVLVAFLLVWSVGGLTGFHMYLIGHNMTTHEQLRAPLARRNGILNPFDFGSIYLNCVWVLCRPLVHSSVNVRGFFEPESIEERVSGPDEETLTAPQMTSATNLSSTRGQQDLMDTIIT
ncbi:hypothetical protein G9A89_018874 [Geosiphon pyriformis]|nr:hypothetical protein G9A89_018874 [Geosiphon pyriformis]